MELIVSLIMVPCVAALLMLVVRVDKARDVLCMASAAVIALLSIAFAVQNLGAGSLYFDLPMEYSHFLAVVKIVIAEGDEVIAAEVQKPCRDTVPVTALTVEIIGQGAALKDIPAVDDEGIAVVGKAVHAVGKTRLRALAAGIVDRGKVTVDIACIVYRKLTLHGDPFKPSVDKDAYGFDGQKNAHTASKPLSIHKVLPAGFSLPDRFSAPAKLLAPDSFGFFE